MIKISGDTDYYYCILLKYCVLIYLCHTPVTLTMDIKRWIHDADNFNILTIFIIILYYCFLHFVAQWVTYWRPWVYMLRSKLRSFTRAGVRWTCRGARIVDSPSSWAREEPLYSFPCFFNVIIHDFVIFLYLINKLDFLVYNMIIFYTET